MNGLILLSVILIAKVHGSDFQMKFTHIHIFNLAKLFAYGLVVF